MLIIVVLLLASRAFASQLSYDGYKVYKMALTDKSDCDEIKKFESSIHYDFLKDVNCKGYPVVVMVSPLGQKYFEDVLRQRNIQYEIKIENMHRAISEERNKYHSSRQNKKGEITFDAYYGYDDIYAYLESLSKTYPKKVQLLEIGKTYEGRKIPAVKISSGGGGNRPAIFIDVAHHAREWASIVPVLHLIHQLVKNETCQYLTKKIDWIIIPVLNVDGYEYTRKTDRMWRANRQKHSNGCYGTDPNRNYDILWESGIGTSDQCTNSSNSLYKGVSPFSAAESSAVAGLVQKYNNKIKLYVTMHTYSNVILVPYAYSENADEDAPEDDKEIRSLGKSVADAIYNYNGSRYSVGTPFETIRYAASGGSFDWVKVKGGVDLTFGMEVTDESFIFPEKQLKYLVAEIFEAFKTFHHYVEEKFAT